MRRVPVLRQGAAVRILVDLSSDPSGRVSGRVAVADEPSAPFSGWLELLRLLEDRVHDQPQEDAWDG
jgi:hypothetical protein